MVQEKAVKVWGILTVTATQLETIFFSDLQMLMPDDKKPERFFILSFSNNLSDQIIITATR